MVEKLANYINNTNIDFGSENLEMRDLINEIVKFRDERNWKQFHNPKDLAISISLEASELLETFQWSSWEETIMKKKEKVAEELADVLIYAILLSNELDFDVEKIIKDKIEKNKEKYPIEKSFGKKEKYTDLGGK